MKLTKIEIQNFKSIQEIEFDIKKHGNSYTTMLLGVNESGKSNILEAMSFFDVPEADFEYDDFHNQKDDESSPVDLWFSLIFENKTTCADALKKEFENGDLLNFQITNITKNVYLFDGKANFEENYSFEIENLSKGIFFKKIASKVITVPSGRKTVDYQLSKTQEDEFFEELTNDHLKDLFADKIIKIIKTHEPRVTFWKPSKEYLISSDEDLTVFSSNINSKPALKNIFMLAGYKDKNSIVAAIENVSNGKQRNKLESKLQDSLDRYIKKVWKHDIDIVVDITETGKFTLLIKDSGEANKHDRHYISGRSAGAQHFLSLILSLSIESEHDQLKNQLILIDEPEVHLHPSAIRDLRDELLKIGKNNYVFASTHSPFLIDRKNKERNVIVKKNSSALTEKFHIEDHTNLIDDEVLQEAFGLEVYKDLLNPHSILVEGASDKVIIQKVLTIKGKQEFGVTNGHGSNIDTLASKLNETNISPLVMVDDDKDGKAYKTKIIKLGGSYSSNNVATIRDLVGTSVDGATIEDFLGTKYVESTFKTTYKTFYSETQCDIQLNETQPLVKQMKTYLHTKAKNDAENFIEIVKSDLASKLELTKGNLTKNFPLLDKLGDEIIKKLNAVTNAQ